MTDRVVWPILAGLLTAVGVLATLVRPLAPEVGSVSTTLDDFSPVVLSAVADYRAERHLAGVLALLVSVAVPAAFALTRVGRRVVTRIGDRGRRLVGASVVAATISVTTMLAILPLALWSGFLHERDWGFSTTTSGQWLRDRAVTDGVAVLVAVVGAVVFVWFRRRWPGSWNHRLVVVGTVLTGALVMLQPLVIQPLLLSTEPLEAGATRDEVSAVLQRAGEGELEILVGDASRRTTKANAYVSGLGPSRQVVLFDNLLELPPQQVAVVVAHELAHREHADIPRGVLAAAAGLFVAFVVLRWWLKVAARGGASVGDPRAVAMLLLVLAAGQVVAAPVVNWASRRAEAAADHRALELTGAASRAVATQRGFVVRDLVDPDPPWWVTSLWGTHPSVEHRIQAAVAFARRHDLELPARSELTRVEPVPAVGPGP